MSRVIVAQEQVNANVNHLITVDLDAQSTVEEVGTVPAAVAATCVATEYGDSLIHKTVLTCTSMPISVADDAGVAQYGGVKVYTMPKGLIASLGGMISGNLTMGVTGTFIDAFTGVNALGTVTATTGATLVAGEATWLQEVANATAATKVAALKSVSIATQLTETSARIFDGTVTAAPVFFNVAIADDVTHTAGTGTFTGTITLVWLKVAS